MKKSILFGVSLALSSPVYAWIDHCDPAVDLWYEEINAPAAKKFVVNGQPGWWDSDVGTTAGPISSGFVSYANRYQYNYFSVFRKLIYGSRTLRALETYSDGTASLNNERMGSQRGVKSQLESVDISSIGSLVHNYTDSGNVQRSDPKALEVFNNSVAMRLKFFGDSEKSDVVFYQLYPDVYDANANHYTWRAWLLVFRTPDGEILIKSAASGTEVVYKVDGIILPEDQFYEVKTDMTLSTVEKNQGSFRFYINPENVAQVHRQVRRRTGTNPETWGALEDAARINVLGPCGTTTADQSVKLPRRVHFAAGIYSFNKSSVWPHNVKLDQDFVWVQTSR